MFLKEIHVKNFKGFDDLHFSFVKENGEVRKHTVLLGENGTGKSNLLKAIALITASPDAILELLKQPNEWIKQGENTCTIEATTSYGHNLKLTWNRGEKPSQIVTQNLKNTAEISHFNSLYQVYAYGASRKLSFFNELSFDLKQNYEYAQNVANLFDNDHILYPITKWLIDLDYNGQKKNIYNEFKNFTVKKLDSFLNYTIIFKDIDPEERTLLFKENGKILPLKALSDGYQNMTALFGDLISKWSNRFDWAANETRYQNFPEDAFNNISDNQGLILIDELDLHLHPKWQRALLDFLARELPSFQIIATTHSPLTAQQAGEGELFTLKKDENGKVGILPFIGSPDKLLVSDLLTAKDAFGLNTTESLRVERLKNRYRELKDNTQKTENEENEWKQIQMELQIIPNGKGSAYFSEEHYKLLQTLKAELNL